MASQQVVCFAILLVAGMSQVGALSLFDENKEQLLRGSMLRVSNEEPGPVQELPTSAGALLQDSEFGVSSANSTPSHINSTPVRNQEYSIWLPTGERLCADNNGWVKLCRYPWEGQESFWRFDKNKDDSTWTVTDRNDKQLYATAKGWAAVAKPGEWTAISGNSNNNPARREWNLEFSSESFMPNGEDFKKLTNGEGKRLYASPYSVVRAGVGVAKFNDTVASHDWSKPMTVSNVLVPAYEWIVYKCSTEMGEDSACQECTDDACHEWCADKHRPSCVPPELRNKLGGKYNSYSPEG